MFGTRLFSRSSRFAFSEKWGLSVDIAIWLLRHARDFDVVHLQYVWCTTSFVGCLAGKLAGVPVVVTPHESLTRYDIEVASRSRILRVSKGLIKSLYLRLVDCIVFMSRLEERGTALGETRSVLIHHAVAETISTPERPVPEDDHRPLRIAYLGRVAPKKNLHLLVAAVAHDQGRGWRLSIAGPGSLLDTRERHEPATTGDRIIRLGFLEDRGDLFRDSDVLVMPSDYEGFGMVAAEAMSYGLPVIVTRQSGVAEIVEEFGAGIVIEKPELRPLVQR